MENVKEMRWVEPRSWWVTLASLVPLWLFSLSITQEGFPNPPISPVVAMISFGVAIIAGLLLLWMKWMTIELLLYSLIPFPLFIIFDEISTAYKTPFIFMCAFILTAGVVGYQRVQASRGRRALILLGAAIITMVAAAHAVFCFWEMAANLGYERCFPDAYGCPPLPDDATPWWILFFMP